MDAEWRRYCGSRWRGIDEQERREFRQIPGIRESFRFCQRKLGFEDEAIFEQLSAHRSTQKDPKAELDFKQQGNARFKAKDYIQAVALYSKGLRHSSTQSPQAAVLYANRSAALYQLQRYQECLADIRRAQEHNYPRELEHKILVRHASCLHHLGVPDGAYDNRSRGNLGDGGGQGPCCTALPSIQTHSESRDPPSARGKASAVPGEVSPSIALHSDSSRGRHMIATEELRPGEVLIQEEAFAAVLIPEEGRRESLPNEDLHCHHCLGQAELPLPCLSCSFSSYCSELCRQHAWQQYHWLECRLGGLLLALGTFAHLALRTVLVAGMQEVERAQRLGSGSDWLPSEEQSKREDPKHTIGHAGCSGTEGFSGASGRMPKEGLSRYQTIHSLLTHMGQQKPKHRFLCGFTAAAVCCEIKRRGLELQMVSEELETQSAQGQRLSILGEALLRHVLQLECNAQAITVVRDTASATCSVAGVGNSHVAAMEQVRIATAFYSGVSLLNHSCHPNTSITFRNTSIIVRASQHIPAGQEVLHCYGPHWSRMSVKERQRALSLQYFFRCRCTACVSEENKEAGMDSLVCQFLCSRCGVTLQDSEEAHCTCSNSCCGHMVSKQSLIQQVQEIRSLMSNARGLSAGHPDEAFHLLSKCQRVAQSLLSSHHPVQGEIEDCLAQVYASQADWTAAARHLRMSCDLVRIQFGDRSVELGKQLFKLAQILFNGHVMDEALSVIEQAECLLSLHCGAEHEMMIELSEMKSCLQTLPSQFPVSP
ncbi:SET and MYND domain-containing protein 4 isoform X1 [Carcharodon carcharias]|uniref:SET and MYND domain-containing protein 4 isoform X1 n=2 Tax=Carcharodon carcharias TaxID=13397 RepID=UPI001B7EDA14|nr:SET and MYND domain-containing protein 4 isoform X1 [Carcharodon carcharias]